MSLVQAFAQSSVQLQVFKASDQLLLQASSAQAIRSAPPPSLLSAIKGLFAFLPPLFSVIKRSSLWLKPRPELKLILGLKSPPKPSLKHQLKPLGSVVCTSPRASLGSILGSNPTSTPSLGPPIGSGNSAGHLLRTVTKRLHNFLPSLFLKTADWFFS